MIALVTAMVLGTAANGAAETPPCLTEALREYASRPDGLIEIESEDKFNDRLTRIPLRLSPKELETLKSLRKSHADQGPMAFGSHPPIRIIVKTHRFFVGRGHSYHSKSRTNMHEPIPPELRDIIRAHVKDDSDQDKSNDSVWIETDFGHDTWDPGPQNELTFRDVRTDFIRFVGEELRATVKVGDRPAASIQGRQELKDLAEALVIAGPSEKMPDDHRLDRETPSHVALITTPHCRIEVQPEYLRVSSVGQTRRIRYRQDRLVRYLLRSGRLQGRLTQAEATLLRYALSDIAHDQMETEEAEEKVDYKVLNPDPGEWTVRKIPTVKSDQRRRLTVKQTSPSAIFELEGHEIALVADS